MRSASIRNPRWSPPHATILTFSWVRKQRRRNNMTATPKRKTDIGPPPFEKFLHPVIKKNDGTWKYHETLAAGVLVYVAAAADEIYTVRAASPRLLSIQTLRLFA